MAGSRARLPSKGKLTGLSIAYIRLGQAFLKGGGNVIIIVIVSLIGSLRKGYGLIDDVASYSST
jgi:hypothetical protein